MHARMLTLYVLMLTAMCFTMVEPVPVGAEAKSDISSNLRQKRQFLYGYPSYSTYSYYPSYGRLYYPSLSIWG
ncbi:unnamed protein product [Cylicocyclus nassatus]|uniref:Uncharacterized protein n=1 Tax=Cylicocyclus nassatus TaxID=53992 RepID=A0AA36H803_CYLNA|nr:unnamed protein product [Cylicocyclus nassatus]